MFDETYSLRIVTNHLRKLGIPFEHNSAKVGTGFNEHGCRVKLDEVYKLSIQTHPDVVGDSFAETALQNMLKKQICYDGTHGYYDVRRWGTPEELIEHVKSLVGTNTVLPTDDA